MVSFHDVVEDSIVKAPGGKLATICINQIIAAIMISSGPPTITRGLNSRNTLSRMLNSESIVEIFIAEILRVYQRY